MNLNMAYYDKNYLCHVKIIKAIIYKTNCNSIFKNCASVINLDSY
jgi:hypothetical protein